LTSNVIGHHRGLKRKLPAGYRATSLQSTSYLLSSSVVSGTFSAVCMYSKFGRHPHPLGYPSAKFCFFHGLHCWASPWRIIAGSLSHSTSLFDASGTEAFALELPGINRDTRSFKTAANSDH